MPFKRYNHEFLTRLGSAIGFFKDWLASRSRFSSVAGWNFAHQSQRAAHAEFLKYQTDDQVVHLTVRRNRNHRVGVPYPSYFQTFGIKTVASKGFESLFAG